MRALAGLLCGLLGLVPGAAAYEPDVFGTAGQVAGQAVYDLGGSGLPCRRAPSTGPAPPPFPIACRRRPRCPRRASPRSATKAP